MKNLKGKILFSPGKRLMQFLFSLQNWKQNRCRICHLHRKKIVEKKLQLDITAHLQAVLLAPLYCKTKLMINNYTIHNKKNKDVFYYTWNEDKGGANSNEFTSILIDFIEDELQENLVTVVIWIDGSTYQNHNCN